LRLLAEELSNRANAQRLVISEKTAGRHVANVDLKLGVHSRLQAVRVATQRKLVVALIGRLRLHSPLGTSYSFRPMPASRSRCQPGRTVTRREA
jgi:hypothetical protein